jgi:hypothetical protein
MSKSKGSREVMPEEPQHVLLEGKKDSVFHGESLVRELLEELLEDEAVDCEQALPLGSMKPDRGPAYLPDVILLQYQQQNLKAYVVLQLVTYLVGISTLFQEFAP